MIVCFVIGSPLMLSLLWFYLPVMSIAEMELELAITLTVVGVVSVCIGAYYQKKREELLEK